MTKNKQLTVRKDNRKSFREGTFFIGEEGGGGILDFFCEKTRGPPTSRNRLRHDPSEIAKQKRLTLPLPLTIQDKNNRKWK